MTNSLILKVYTRIILGLVAMWKVVDLKLRLKIFINIYEIQRLDSHLFYERKILKVHPTIFSKIINKKWLQI
jgi:hypothetical protein